MSAENMQHTIDNMQQALGRGNGYYPDMCLPEQYMVEQIVVRISDKPGELAKLTNILGNAGINLHALSSDEKTTTYFNVFTGKPVDQDGRILDKEDRMLLRLIVCSPAEAKEELLAKGYTVSTKQTLAVSISDEPGSLATVLSMLAEAGIDIKHAYTCVAKKGESAYAIIRVEDKDNERAMKLFARQGVEPAGSEVCDL